MSDMDKIEGRNPVLEAIKSGIGIEKIYVRRFEGKNSLTPIINEARKKGIAVSETDQKKLDEMSETHSHQGIIAQISAVEYADIDDILKVAREKNEPPLVIVLDKIEDTGNLGSIIRTAECAGVHGIIIPKHGGVGLNATVAKSSAGAIFNMPVARVTNLAQTVDRLKKEGIWIIGADMNGKNSLYDDIFSGPIAIIIGGENNGISRLLLEKCDFTVNIPMRGRINSLNASVASAIMIYRAVEKR